MTETSTTTTPDYRYVDPKLQQGFIEQSVVLVKPADEALKPLNIPEIKRQMIEEGIVPTGVFASAELFPDTDQRTFRRETIIAQSMVEIMGHEDNPHLSDPAKRIAWQLTALTVQANVDRAVMVEAAKQYHDKQRAGTLTAKEADFLRERLEQAQNSIYPQIDPELATQTLERLNGRESTHEPLLSREAREAWHAFLHERYDPVFATVYEQFDDVEEIDGQLMADMTRAFMREVGLPMTDDETDISRWKVIYDPDAVGFRVTPSEKKIVLGPRKVPATRLAFEKLMMHEVVVHAQSAENGSQTGYMAFQTGVPGYLEPEEGFGLLMESLWSGEEPDRLGRDHYRYAAVAYADGAYDGTKHSEQETHDFIRPLMEKNGIGDNTNELFMHVMRVFRGMPPECRMRSNASYLSGKMMMMRLIEQQYRDGVPIADSFDELRAGKINRCDKDQVELLRAALSRTAAEETV